MDNAGNSDIITNSENKVIYTANELANVLGENYKGVAKTLKVLATEGKIDVTEKFVNNRPLKGFILGISDIQNIKSKFNEKKHFPEEKNAPFIQMVANAYKQRNTAEIGKDQDDLTNVKIYEVMKENAELTKEVDRLKADLTTAKNENVRLDADLTKTKSEIKLIENKSETMEAAYSEKKIQLEEKERELKSVEGKLHASRVIIAIYSAVALVVLTVIITVYLMRSFGGMS